MMSPHISILMSQMSHLMVQVPPEEHVSAVLVPGLDPDQPGAGPRRPEDQGVPVWIIAPQSGVDLFNN